MAALVALVVLVWPPDGLEAASPYVHAEVHPLHSHLMHAKERRPQRVLPFMLDANCHASAFGCCAMAHCHPAISVDPHEMTNISANDDETAAVAEQGLGSDPGVILPPPRR